MACVALTMTIEFITSIIPTCVAVLTLSVLLIATLVPLSHNMAVTKPARQAHHIKHLIVNAVIMSICLIVIMINIAMFIKQME